MDEDKVARNGNGSGPDMAAGSHAGSHPKLKQDDLARADRLKKYRFPKGQSGNPGGRPKRLSVTDRLRAVARISGANR